MAATLPDIRMPVYVGYPDGQQYQVGHVDVPINVAFQTDLDEAHLELSKYRVQDPPVAQGRVTDKTLPSNGDIVPDYAQDSRLVDIVAKLQRNAAAQQAYNNGHGTWSSWDTASENVKRTWRLSAEEALRRETGHGGE